MADVRLFTAKVAICATLTWPGIAAAQEEPEQGALHVAKVVCGTQPDHKNLQFVRGIYATGVNLLNAGDGKQKIALRLALAHPPVPPEAGDVLEMPPLELDAGQAGAVDCEDVKARVFPFGLPDSYIDGFLVIEHQGGLSVQAVYTAAPLIDDKCCKARPGPVASIDVERVSPAPASQAPGRLADLLPKQPVRDTDPLGQPGTGFCTEQPADGGPPDATAEIVNQGEVAAPASLAWFDFGAFGQADAPVPPLDSGARHTVTADIPTDCFGTGPEGTCAFVVTADAGEGVEESLETNNKRAGHCLRSAQGVQQ